jgi:hypothetical protein
MTRGMSDADPATDPDHQKVRLRCQAELKPITNKEWLRSCGIMAGRRVPCEVLKGRMKLYGDQLACRESRVVKSTSANGGLVTAASTVGASMARSGGSGDVSRPITINAPITVEGRAGTPEQKRDLAKQISKSIEQPSRWH